MARRRTGLTIGQVLTLTLGFAAASVLIFGFGWWAGYDAAEQRLTRDRPIVRHALPTPGATPSEVPVPGLPPDTTLATLAPRIPAPTPSATPSYPAFPMDVTPTATQPPTATIPVRPTIGAAEQWSVQVAATRDAVQAVVLKRRLQEAGYDAHAMERAIGGATWYRVRVGPFPNRAAAEVALQQLRAAGYEAAYVTAQREGP